MTYRCPKGHESTEPDFCSECGARISNSAVDQTAEVCPACGVPRGSKDSNFCEVCGYNFATKVAGGVPIQPQVVPEKPRGWTVTLSVDGKLKSGGSPDPPSGFAPLTMRLEKPLNLIGRSSESRAIFPEIALDFDDAVSHRHALLTQSPAGDLVLRDIGSSNGTQLNGNDIAPMTDHPLHDGDQLTLGHWTRIDVKAMR